MLIVVPIIFFILFFFFLYIKIENLIEDIIKYKNVKSVKSSLVNFATAGALLVFHISELIILKKKYLTDDDIELINEYKRVIVYYWIHIVWFLAIIFLDFTTLN
jgi:hypothetical protein